MKTNYIGIFGSVLAFISLVLPWWTISMTSFGNGIFAETDVLVYLYPRGFMPGGVGLLDYVAWWFSYGFWFGWAALGFVIIGGLIGVVGSVTKYGSKLLIGSGALALISLIIFAVGLQMELPKLISLGLSEVGLFSSGTISFNGATVNYSTYLSFGFWLVLVAAILMLVASKKRL